MRQNMVAFDGVEGDIEFIELKYYIYIYIIQDFFKNLSAKMDALFLSSGFAKAGNP